MSRPKSKIRYLTQNELQILNLLIKGNDMKQIASSQFMTHRAVSARLDHLRQAYGCHTTIQLVAMLIKTRLLSDHPIDGPMGPERSEHIIRMTVLEDLRTNINKLINTYKTNL